MFAGAGGEGSEPQPANCFHFIGPDNFPGAFDAAVAAQGQQEIYGFILAHGSHGMKGQAAVGDIENEAAVFRAHADIGDLHELGSWSLTAVGNRLRGCAHLYY